MFGFGFIMAMPTPEWYTTLPLALDATNMKLFSMEVGDFKMRSMKCKFVPMQQIAIANR